MTPIIVESNASASEGGDENHQKQPSSAQIEDLATLEIDEPDRQRRFSKRKNVTSAREISSSSSFVSARSSRTGTRTVKKSRSNHEADLQPLRRSSRAKNSTIDYQESSDEENQGKVSSSASNQGDEENSRGERLEYNVPMTRQRNKPSQAINHTSREQDQSVEQQDGDEEEDSQDRNEDEDDNEDGENHQSRKSSRKSQKKRTHIRSSSKQHKKQKGDIESWEISSEDERPSCMLHFISRFVIVVVIVKICVIFHDTLPSLSNRRDPY